MAQTADLPLRCRCGAVRGVVRDAVPSKDDDADDRFLWTCTVITTDAPDDLGKIHDRMPLMVEPERWAAWLDPRTDKDSVLDLLVPAAPGVLEAYPVSTMVNAVKNNGPELLEPLALS